MMQTQADTSGVAPVIVGDYVIQFKAAGPLAPNLPSTSRGAIDPENLHDIIIEVGYGLD